MKGMGKVPTKQRRTSGRQAAPRRNVNLRAENRTAQYRPTERENNYNGRYYGGSYNDPRSYAARQTRRPDAGGAGYYDAYRPAAQRTYDGSAYRTTAQNTYDKTVYRTTAQSTYNRTAYRTAEPRSYGAYPAAPAERGYKAPERTAPAPERKILTREERLANKRKFRSRLRVIGVIALVFLMSAILIYRQTAIFGKNRQIESLNSDLNGIIVTNEGIQSSIDRSIELGNLESFAKNRLGMINPDSSQIFYIDMGAGDEVVKSSSSK